MDGAGEAMGRISIFLISLTFGLATWVIDAVIESAFYFDGSFWDYLILAVPSHELFMRVAAVLCFAGFGLLLGHMFAKLQRAERAEKRERRRMLTLLRELPAFVYVVDEEYTLRFANLRFRENFGDAEGKPCHEVLARRDEPCEGCPIQRITQNEHAEDEEWSPHEGQTFEIHRRPFVDEDGRTLMLAMGIDVTERRRMADELLKAQKLESLGVLAGGLAHDFNNILAAAMGYLSVARLSASDTQVQNDLDEIGRALQRARELTQQLLTFSRGGAPVKVVVDVPAVVQEAADFASHGSDLRCAVELRPGILPIEADPGQISRVLQNLVRNAGDAMGPAGEVLIRAENMEQVPAELGLGPGRYVHIAVSDTGVGIPEHALGKIFDPYFTTKQKSHGLGLAMVYSIIANHGGRITVESQLGVGTTMHIYLAAASRTDVTLPPVLLPATGSKGRILVMDDDESVRAMLSRLLELLGFSAAFAHDGREAIEIYQDARRAGRPFDLVLMDLSVPGGMGGQEAMRRLRELDPAVRAVVVSGYSDDPVMAQFREHGFRGVLRKPFDIEELRAAIRRGMARDHEGDPAEPKARHGLQTP